jgi:hypothetical protein
MNAINWKKLLPAGAAVVLFVILALAYFSPVLEGKHLVQGDIRNFLGMSRDVVEHREAYSEEPLWAESMFSGMPAYQISVKWSGSALTFLDKAFHGFLPMPAGFLFLYLLGMYILLMCLRVDPWLALVGALAFAFSSYFFVILEAGHNSKANAIGYMPAVLGGLYVLLRGNKWLGAALFALFLSLLIYVNHVQVAYYLGMVLVLFGLAEAWRAVREKHLGDFAVRAGLAIVGVAFALLSNTGLLWSTYEYGKFTTRGPSELTITPEGSSAKENQTSGLDRDYVTQWSYGKQESFSLLVPNAKGGASGSLIRSQEDLQAIPDPAFRTEVAKKYQDGGYVNSYWGDQSFTSGPVYVGAIVLLLMVLMLARAEGKARWWILGAIPLTSVMLMITDPLLSGALLLAYLIAGIFLWSDTLAFALFSSFLLALMLSWGRNYMPLTDFFLDHIPGYDKFRAVTIILVIVELAAPVLAVLYLDRLLREGKWDKEKERGFLIPAGGLILLLMALALIPGSFMDFFSDAEKAELATGSQAYIDGLKGARIGVFTADVWRSLAFVVLAAGALFAFGRGLIGRWSLVAALGVLLLVDLWSVDKRYVNNEMDRGRYLSWEDGSQSRLPFKPQPADLAILQSEQNAATEADLAEALVRLRAAKQADGALGLTVTKDEEMIQRFGSLRRTTNYRVLTLQNPFNDSRVSYFHKSLGGYHGAKLKRYQELIEFHINREMQDVVAGLRGGATLGTIDSAFAGQGVLNMLNMKYLIYANDKAPLRNSHALGAGWFVDEVRVVKNADEEITALGTIDTRRTALVDERFTKEIDVKAAHGDSTATVSLKSFRNNEMIYDVRSANGGVVVFSEVWYGPDWKAEIDGAPAPYGRVNYALRGMNVPAGEHTVRFHIVSKPYNTGGRIASISSWALLVLVLLTIGMVLRGGTMKEAATK